MADMRAHLSEQVVNEIASRLSNLPIRLPLSAGESPDSSNKAEYLTNLLRRDPGVFLERHADSLNADERAFFEPLRGDYEVSHDLCCSAPSSCLTQCWDPNVVTIPQVDFYLKQQEDAAKESREVTVRNRRLARINQLESEGDFFTEVHYCIQLDHVVHTPQCTAGPAVSSRLLMPHRRRCGRERLRCMSSTWAAVARPCQRCRAATTHSTGWSGRRCCRSSATQT